MSFSVVGNEVAYCGCYLLCRSFALHSCSRNRLLLQMRNFYNCNNTAG
jgi:hypothetical protein